MNKIGDKVMIIPENWTEQLQQNTLQLQYGTITGFSEKSVLSLHLPYPLKMVATDVQMEGGSKKKFACMEADHEGIFSKSEFLHEIYNEMHKTSIEMKGLQERLNRSKDQLKTVKIQGIRDLLNDNVRYCKNGIRECHDRIEKLEGLMFEVEADRKLDELGKDEVWKPKVKEKGKERELAEVAR